MTQLPRIAITTGDPAGVGPELCLKLLRDERVRELCVPVVIGDADVLARLARHLGWPEPERVLDRTEWANFNGANDAACVLDLKAIDAGMVRPGTVSAACGKAAYDYVNCAIDEALAGRVDAIATGPLHKEALHAAGIPFPGHTEILASRTNADRSCMMLTAEAITCSLVTVHVGYREVPALLTTERIRDTIDLTAAAIQRIRGRAPRLLVCGLNPHAGEHGLFGDSEEERIILPAIESARAAGIDVDGPLPPDTAFLPKYRAACDAYVCMYHDQGLIPLKALAFEEAVNITLGLPIVRTSVDHGTAFDIAWKGVADVSSFVQAVKLAAKLCGSAN
ncbi:4-hydroxythreonine-4-phosphate dehydrogenase : 4-hydroxythreonine-4-phosphate dehydrogenase OS=uncultured Verrucomicrobia bacterium GN=pdxA PE=3 SV=1: PdxA [Gemmata massiliana]|uniref:4-hydroxythreonine-4-phosphate dehydrogenase n=1 Tax=Gemmata massiliana TaxID=1210884 RepID=A0A6P2CS83_9BACT|nr:4-hydroxythreonine-4-phosphate dehydrogenase PdxA [Gemmata massiliana]VTR91958.1 4-hydroxythreonine-4-phosphate dehydrogenase : 4-hydroxythreonine-4-phosphate dehydrogenase OS=uncultured Verrucomicrobia bacterium GN=pdxA PE=3 SV=1: PdxA [Gemmata massiliana]